MSVSESKTLSVIVPCYKVEQYLPRCLESLVNQTLEGLEVICINDGSPDNCLSILNDYHQQYPDIVTIIDKENEGVWRGRWDGIAAAKGEYIGFVDSDDYVEPYFAEELYSTAVNNKADIAVGGFRRIDLSSGKTLSTEMCTLRPDFVISEEPGRLVELNGAPWNKCFKASVLKNAKDLVSPPPVLDDIAFHLLAYLSSRGKVAFTDKPLVNYFVRSGSIINSITENQVDAVFQAFKEVKTHYIEDCAPEPLIEALDAAAFLHIGVSFIFRLSYDENIDLKRQIQKHTEYLDAEFPTWRRSPYINWKYARETGGAFKKLQIAKMAYDTHTLPFLLGAYRKMIEGFGVDVKW